MRLLIDTNRYSDGDRGDPAVIARFEKATELWIPLVVLGELRAGFMLGGRRKANEANLRRFLSHDHVGVLLPSEETAVYYARVKARLQRAGTPIPANDIWIAAQALEHNLTLDTRDKHFKSVPGLRIHKG